MGEAGEVSMCHRRVVWVGVLGQREGDDMHRGEGHDDKGYGGGDD
jgi:hypothetical protein